MGMEGPPRHTALQEVASTPGSWWDKGKRSWRAQINQDGPLPAWSWYFAVATAASEEEESHCWAVVTENGLGTESKLVWINKPSPFV